MWQAPELRPLITNSAELMRDTDYDRCEHLLLEEWLEDEKLDLHGNSLLESLKK